MLEANRKDLVSLTAKGLYCAEGDFYIDPWLPVERAVLTHAHGDHARSGSESYLAHEASASILKHRLGSEIRLQSLKFSESIQIGSTKVSLHSAGHILGSAQVRVESRSGEVWVVSGDYKRDEDATCDPFEPVRCDTIITEATFGLPIYFWKPTRSIAEEILEWWKFNQEQGICSILFCYALGKSQRVLAALDEFSPLPGPIYLHGTVFTHSEFYREQGIRLAPYSRVTPLEEQTKSPRSQAKKDFSKSLVIAPPSAFRSPWMKRFGDCETAFASGWMQLRGVRRYRGYDRGFVLSDHADWPSLLKTLEESEASRILVTHGEKEILSHYLRDLGHRAEPLETEFSSTGEDEAKE